MSNEVKTIAVLTSGGDAPGMNAAIRAVVRTGIAKGINVKGILRGYAGLLNEEIIDMDTKSVADIIERGGTILYTARSKYFATDEGHQIIQLVLIQQLTQQWKQLIRLEIHQLLTRDVAL